MKILVLTDSFYPGIGGTETALLGFAEELNKKHQVMLACPAYHQHEIDNFAFPVVRVPSLSLGQQDKMVLASFCPSTYKQLRDFQPDIIHIQTASGMAKIGLKLAKKLKIPAVMTIHTRYRDAFSDRIKIKFAVKIMLKSIVSKLNKADTVCTVIDSMATELTDYGYHKKDIHVIKNGTNTEIPADLNTADIRAELGVLPDENLLLFVGMMIKYKNVEFLLKSFKIALEKGFTGKLILVGTGLDINNFKNLAEKLGIAAHVIFTGRIPENLKVKQIYAAADLFVTASYFDTDPMVVVEAATLGTPTLTLEDSPCASRIENDISGFLVASTEADFADKLLQIFDDKKHLTAVSANAQKLIPVSWEENVNQYIQIYEDLLTNK